MNRTALSIIGLVSCCGLAASTALAQPSVINISGASLLENYVRSLASTNDFIDVDGDGVAGILNTGVDQLAPAVTGNNYPGNLRWIVQYRVTGSVNGLTELFNFGSPNAATGNDANTAGILGARPLSGVAGNATTAYANRTAYITAGSFSGVYNQGNPGGAPYRNDLTSLATAQWAAAPTSASGSVRIDISPVDVPSFWAVQKVGTPNPNDKPSDAGYGRNPRRSVSRAGLTTGFANESSELPPLGARNLYTGVPASANANTIFDNPLSYAVIVPVVNQGTGLTQVTTSDLKHMFATGRTVTGENLMIVTRDTGSGTRNAFQNCIGQDPSWGVGDNVGALSTLTVNNNLGAQFTPTNKGATGGVEAVMRNARLGVGYLGGERGVTGSGSASWLFPAGGNPLEIPSVRNDIYGGTQFVRPTTQNIVSSGANGWVIGGPAVLVTVGDPKAEPIALGGQGLTTPRMANNAAAAYLNNITRSITAFVSVPSDSANFGMPGEYAATQFTLSSALSLVQSTTDATTLIANPAFSASVQAYTLTNSVYNNARFANPDFSHAGRVPTRTTGVVYSDGVLNGANYIQQNGTALTYGSALSLRNKICGDFDGNAARNIGDTTELVKAYRSRNGGPVWAAPSGTFGIIGASGGDACIEILGDFDGNGSFDITDVRFFADGLAIATTGPSAGKLDRKAGFIEVDNASQSLGGPLNFFNTVLATGTAYTAGAARGDVAGTSGANARGFAPVGSDGLVNAFDIDFVFAQFARNTAAVSGRVVWSNIDQAATFDLSADMTGDLAVDIADVNELLTILGTSMGDVNLDGSVNAADLAIIDTNLNTAGGWARGDLNGDGLVNQADRDILNSILNPAPVCIADVAGGGDLGNLPDGTIDGTDFIAFINSFGIGDASVDATADVAGGGANGDEPDGTIDGSDFIAFINAFAAGC